MMKLIAVFILVIFIEKSHNANMRNKTEVEEAFIKFGLHSRLELPKKKLIVHYTDDIEVNLGEFIKLKDELNIPRITYDADLDSFYTLIVVDIDSPRPDYAIMGELLLWQIVNIPGSKINKGQTLVEYTPSWPSQSQGIHRIVFLLFKQPHKQIFNEIYIPSMRMPMHFRIGFSTLNFVLKYNMDGPVAGNFHQIEYDNSYFNEI